MSRYKKPLPVSSPESQPFWDGCRQHELLVQQCAECRAFWFPPSIMCPECLSTAWEWTKISGQGRVYSFVIFHRVYHTGFTDEIPYVVAAVELEEGPRLMSNIIGCDPYAVHCEMAVEVVFEDVSETVTLPKFRPRKNFHWR